mgnify:CR=1 FL=1
MKDNLYFITFGIIFLCLFPFLLTVGAAEYKVSGALYNRWEVPHVAEDGVVGVGEHPVVLYDSAGKQLASGQTSLDASFSLTYEGTTSIDQEDTQEGPTEYKLGHPYPNPFNPQTKINYVVPSHKPVSLKIYNIKGELVETIINNKLKTPGKYSVRFDGSKYSSGIYISRLKVGNKYKTRKMMLIK